MRNNMAKRLQELEGRTGRQSLGPMVWQQHDQTPEQAKAAAGLAPDASCVFFKWSAPQ